jgi:anti-sigma B factor antagonist
VANVPCPYLIVDTDHDEHGPVLRLRGELDLASKEVLETAMSAALDSRPQSLVVDLSELTFMDCAGASVLRRAHDLLTTRQAQLLVTGARPIVQRLFGLLALDTYLNVRTGGGRNRRRFCWN